MKTIFSDMGFDLSKHPPVMAHHEIQQSEDDLHIEHYTDGVLRATVPPGQPALDYLNSPNLARLCKDVEIDVSA